MRDGSEKSAQKPGSKRDEIEEVKEVREYEATGRRSARQVIWPGWGPSRFRVNESVTTHDSRVPVTLSIV